MLSFHVESAIAAHKAWARRLEFYINGIDPEVIAPEVAADFHICILGTWIDSIAGEYAHLESFMHLVMVHKQFHELAASIVRMKDKGDSDEANKLLAEQLQTHVDSVSGALRVFKNEAMKAI